MKNFKKNQISKAELQATKGGRGMTEESCRAAGGNYWVINGKPRCVFQM